LRRGKTDLLSATLTRKRLALRQTSVKQKKAFIEVFKSSQVKQFIEEKLPAFIPAGFNS
jgi:hypothetical protein